MTKKIPKKKGLTPKQKKLVSLLPDVEAGKLSKMAAMKKAGYADSTAREQSRVMGQVGTNSKMQEALRKAGVTEERIATNIKKGMSSFGGTALGYTKLAAELMDAFPATKNLNAMVDPEELLDRTEKDGEYAMWQDAS